MPSATSLFITKFCIILLSQHALAATPQRLRLSNLNYIYEYGLSSPLPHDDALEVLKVEQQKQQQQQQQSLISSNEIYYNTEQLLQPRRPHWTPDYYGKPLYGAGLEQKYETNKNSGQLTAHTTQIIYAPYAQTYNEPRAPSRQHGPLNFQHKVHSNQKQYAPKRPLDVTIPHEKLLPYPPSFVSITSTTAVPPYSTQSKYNSEQGATSLSRFPDIFATRQHKSLLDSYIPSWVLLRMLQQHKLMQTKKLHQFVATHTLAFPKKGA